MSILRSFILPSIAALGVLVAVPTIASADEHRGGPSTNERARFEHERIERQRIEHERFERERIERIRIEREHERERIREHQLMCENAASAGTPRWRLRQMSCFVR